MVCHYYKWICTISSDPYKYWSPRGDHKACISYWTALIPVRNVIWAAMMENRALPRTGPLWYRWGTLSVPQWWKNRGLRATMMEKQRFTSYWTALIPVRNVICAAMMEKQRFTCYNDGKTEVYLVLDRFDTGEERYLCRNDGKTEVSVNVDPLRIQRAAICNENMK